MAPDAPRPRGADGRRDAARIPDDFLAAPAAEFAAPVLADVVARERAEEDALPATLAAALADRFAIGREVGSGGTARVFAAVARDDGRAVAVKVIRPRFATPAGAARFLREVALVARLRHPGIVPLLASGGADSLLYCVMPLVDGESLRERLRRDGALALDAAVATVRALADALAHAHARGVIHRDLKPENVLLCDGVPLLADFGIALGIGAGAGNDPRVTAPGVRLGTPQYMSPEQAAGEESLGPASDQYALGVLAWEMLAGAPPFADAAAHALLRRVLVEPPPPLRGAREPVPARVEAALRRALAKRPADRFASVEDFAGALG